MCPGGRLVRALHGSLPLGAVQAAPSEEYNGEVDVVRDVGGHITYVSMDDCMEG